MEDDGANYLQTLLIVPPDKINMVQQKIEESCDNTAEAQGFPGPGR
jgi:hypothetical protein